MESNIAKPFAKRKVFIQKLFYDNISNGLAAFRTIYVTPFARAFPPLPPGPWRQRLCHRWAASLPQSRRHNQQRDPRRPDRHGQGVSGLYDRGAFFIAVWNSFAASRRPRIPSMSKKVSPALIQGDIRGLSLESATSTASLNNQYGSAIVAG
jgi:hypothetical protein